MNKIRFLFLALFLLPLSAKASVPESLMSVIEKTYNADFVAAEGEAASYIASNPDDPLGYLVRGMVKDWKQKILNLRGALDADALADYEKANVSAFRAWEKDPDNIDKMIVLGNTYLYVSKKAIDQDKKARAGLVLKKCRKHMEDAIAKDPARYDAYLAIGLFNFFAANVPPGFQGLASLLGMSGNESLGLQQIEQAAGNRNLFQADALFMMTYALGNTKKNFTGAQRYIDQLISKYPSNPYFHLMKGEYALKAKQYEASRKGYLDYIAACPTASEKCAKDNIFLAHYFLAVGYTEEGKFAESATSVATAESLNEHKYAEKDVRLHYMKGMVLKSQGNLEGARAEFKQVEAGKTKNEKAWKLTQEALKGM